MPGCRVQGTGARPRPQRPVWSLNVPQEGALAVCRPTCVHSGVQEDAGNISPRTSALPAGKSPGCLLFHLLVLPHHQLTPGSDACVTSDEALSLPPWHPTSALSPPGAGSAPAGLNDLPAQPAISLCRLRAPEKAMAAPHPAHCPASASGVTWHRAGTR